MVTARLKRCIRLLPLLLCLVPCGCAQPRLDREVCFSTVRSDSFPPAGTTFAVVAADAKSMPDKQQFTRHADALSSVFEQRHGWRRLTDPTKAQCIVIVQYALGPAQTDSYTVPTPVYKTVQYSKLDAAGNWVTDTREVLSHWENSTEYHTYYVTWYSVEAIMASPLPGARAGRQVWKGEADVSTPEPDLDASAALLGATLLPHVGVDAGISRKEIVSASSQEVRALRR